MSDRRLTPEEDDELRLLHSLTTFGAVAHSISSRYHSLRKRDRRNIVRDPDDTKVASPVERKIWADPAPAPRSPSGEQTMSDTREILANQADQKRGGGFFRR